MALILALNPGNSHSPTLARLARELHGCELIGAESCVVAISSIKKRLPDVVLLPAKPARGEADLIAHLKSVPGGVLTLKLPPVESADPVELARQIREMLTGVPASTPSASASVDTPVPSVAASTGTSPHLLAAATAAIDWIHTRRAQWSKPPEIHELDEMHEPQKPREPDEPKLYEPIGPYEALELSNERDEPSAPSGRAGERFSGFVPRAAAAAVVVALVAAAIMYWPQIFGSSEPADSPNASQSVETNQEPVVPQVTPEPPLAEPAPVSGWVAITVPFEVSITEEGKPVTLDDQGRAVLAAGRHRLRFQNSERGYDATRTVQVRPTETTTLTLTPETTIGVTSNEPAEVLIDGTRMGDTPYEGKVGLGTHTVTVKTAGAERQIPVEATSKPVQLEVDFSKP